MKTKSAVSAHDRWPPGSTTVKNSPIRGLVRRPKYWLFGFHICKPSDRVLQYKACGVIFHVAISPGLGDVVCDGVVWWR